MLQIALKHVESQLETAKEEAQRPFPQEDELKEKQARLDQLNIELNMDQKEDRLGPTAHQLHQAMHRLTSSYSRPQ